MIATSYINDPGATAVMLARLIKIDPSGFSLLWKAFGVFFAITLCALAVNNFRNTQSAKARRFQSPVLFIVFAIVGVILLRLPNLLLREQNVDESFMLVNAAKFLSGAVIWKSVSPLTHGPLLFMPLSVMYLLSGALNYTSIRIFGLIFCIIPSIICVFLLFRRCFNYQIASLLLLPLIIFFAFTGYPDIVAYNSEHIPMLLTAWSILLLFSLLKDNHISRWPLVVSGVLVGLFPFAKLQAMPIAFSIAVCILAEIFIAKSDSKPRQFKNMFLFFGAVLIPSFILFIYLYMNNAITFFWNEYILQNLYYTSNGLGSVAKGMARWTLIFKMMDITYDTKWLFRSLAIIDMVALVILIARKQITPLLKNRLLIYLLLITSFSYLSVNAPGNFFEHYQMLFVIPFSVFSGFLFGSMLMQNESLILSKPVLITCLFIILTVPVKSILLKGNRGINFIKDNGSYQINTVSTEIKKYAGPNEKMAIWGWADEYYVETGLLPVRRAETLYEIRTPQNYNNIEAYTRDIENDKPILFIDAVSTHSFYFHNRKTEGHENFPLLNDLVDKDYKLVDEIDSVRIYVLNSRLAEMNKTHVQ